ncbi:guanylate kinase [Apilactobacillus micheneri]|uniref:Guanylate kinase n=1 Tax=Apilactobacillus micheneri TaxID=1899430 RepID=A0A9Q8MUP1_9LACO|nr:AAA family ATPase [Apilactobacillus micheneri]TPR40957.1 guanylate kinase [Apilactobacillus micheneri]TPR42537.1 guanylate kinase [Apilactobacillus micheneri]TPR45506.1 guanylate kinase [Apilactobacillus micheneri]TPR46064.1 guanylate kinase [Apilactobacillus micheneri]TPR46749.1 guanylate kinase [Apilactobacillus micheneri]
MEGKEKLIVITGATGSGKTTVRNYLVNQYHVAKVITHTTRSPRKNEKNDVDYYFESDSSFAKKHFLEHVEYANAKYGSSYEGLKKAWHDNPIASIVLDTQGAITYLNELGNQAIIFFIQVNDHNSLKKRMIERGDSKEKIKQRLCSAEYERDLNIPIELRSSAHIIDNSNWQTAKHTVDKLMHELF